MLKELKVRMMTMSQQKESINKNTEIIKKNKWKL